MLVGARRGVRQVAHALNYLVHGGQGRVVARVGVIAVALEARQILDGNRARGGSGYRQPPTRPSMGLLAVAYRRLGIRPAR